jgi:hypothetical protein
MKSYHLKQNKWTRWYYITWNKLEKYCMFSLICGCLGEKKKKSQPECRLVIARDWEEVWGWIKDAG